MECIEDGAEYFFGVGVAHGAVDLWTVVFADFGEEFEVGVFCMFLVEEWYVSVVGEAPLYSPLLVLLEEVAVLYF